MRDGDEQLGLPLILYKGTQAAIEALPLTGSHEGAVAYATDVNKQGTFDGSAWTWGAGEELAGYSESGDFSTGQTVTGDDAIAMGDDVSVAGNNSAVLGGAGNSITANGYDSVIGGGRGNAISQAISTIAGGENNAISGYYGAVGGGLDHTISATCGVVAGGSDNDIQANYGAIGGGEDNVVSGQYGTVPGGSDNVASGKYSVATGLFAKASLLGQVAHAAGYLAGEYAKLQQTSMVVGLMVTTGSALTDMYLGNEGSTYRLTVPSDSTFMFDIMMVARRADADNESAGYGIRGVIDNNAGTTALVGSLDEYFTAEDSDWTVVVSADDSNDALRIQVGGETGKTIRWVARITLVQIEC